MNPQGEFIIPYLGLTNGEHPYQMDIDNAFFQAFETSEIQKGQLKAEIIFDKRDRMVVLSLEIKGYYEADCDRCLEEIKIPLDIQDRVILKIEETHSHGSEEVYFLEPTTSHIDIAPYIYESIHLHLPIVNYHASEKAGLHDCDPLILEKMRSDEQEQDRDTPISDDPWSALRKLNLE